MTTPESERDVHERIAQRLAVRRWANSRGLRLWPEEVEEMVRRNSRRRPPGVAPAPVEAPRGPMPLTGGAAAPFDFD